MANTTISPMPGAGLPPAARLAIVPLVAIALLAGAILLVGQLLPGGNNVKIAVAIAFFVVAGALLGRVAKGRPELRLPLRAGVLIAALVLTGWYLNSLRGKEVQEQLVKVEAPAAKSGSGSKGAGASQGAGAAAGTQLLASGSFAALDHSGSGGAEIVRAGGELSLQLRDFATDAGPDLRVYLSTDTSASDFVDLGALKGNSGNQVYDIPKATDTAKFGQVLIWCRAFKVGFTAAEVRPPK